MWLNALDTRATQDTLLVKLLKLQLVIFLEEQLPELSAASLVILRHMKTKGVISSMNISHHVLKASRRA